MMPRCLPVQLLTLLGLLLPATLTAQTMILWHAPTHVSPTVLPLYAGGPSPFPQPKIETAEEDELAMALAQREAMRKEALAEAERLMAPRLAYQLDTSGNLISAALDGVQGPRVLVGNEWYAEGATLMVPYRINMETRDALQRLRELDEDTARSMAEQLDRTLMDYRLRGVQVEKIDVKGRSVQLQGPLGRITVTFHAYP